MQLLEREQALSSLREYAAAAAQGDGRVVLLSGEAGAGKSTLVERFEVETESPQWLHGACDGLFTPRPLGPLFDIAEELGGDLQAACRRDAPREELFRSLLGGLTDAFRIVLVEDVHWADESTLDLLRLLSRRLRHLPVLMILTYRDDELGPDHPLRLVLGELAAFGCTRRIGLAPLSEHAVRQLAATSAVDGEELFRLSGGNPFFVTEVLQAGGGRIPQSARDSVLARLGRLTPATRRIAEVAALVGTHMEPDLLAAVGAPTAEELDELAASGLFGSEREGLKFRHELSRLAVADGVPAHRRKHIHVAVLAALCELACADEARLAYHAEGAEDVHGVIRFAPAAAARASALGSHREAAAQYERAIRFAGNNNSAALAEFYDLLVKECALTDSWDRAADAGERARALWREVGNKDREGASICSLSRTMWRLCRPEARQYAAEAVTALEPLGPSPELAWAYATAAKALMQDVRDERSAVLARRAQAIAIDLGLPEVLSDALNTEACVAGAQGGDWEPLIQRALEVAIDAGVQEQAGRAYGNIWMLLLENGRFSDCEKYLREGTQYCDDHDIATYGFCMRAGRAQLSLLQGRWSETLGIARPLLLSGATSPANRAMLAIPIGLVLARRGDSACWADLDEALGNALASGEADWLVTSYRAHAEGHWLEGNLEAARADLAAAVPVAGAAAAAVVDSGVLATWFRRLGMPMPAELRFAPHDPVLHLLSGDFAAAASGWEELGMPYEAAFAHYDSDTEDGLREAVRRFEALGATANVEAARREMRRLGIKSVPSGARRSTRAHPLGLTRRECEVLELLGVGRTNAQISDQLFISQRTVEHHVSAVLMKLGVSSRAGAAEEAVRRAPSTSEIR
jgi:DNA-binding CsgD family transcriptional regulator/tetratricopeptide (TPR) repeat protein